MHKKSRADTFRNKFGFAPLVVSTVLFSSIIFGSAPTASAADLELCPTSAKVQTTTGTWPNQLGTYDDSGFASESGTLAGCSNPVSVIAPNKTDYYLYFSAASLSGKEIFDANNTLRLSVTGAPGAAGWYVQAFLASDGTLLTKTYGGGGTDGRIDYGRSVTLADLSTTTQPANSGSASSPAPTYSVEYGYTLTDSQKTAVLNGDLAIYIGYLGSSSAGANDILTSVKMLYTTPTGDDEGGSSSKSEKMGNPGTFLTLTGRPGQSSAGSTIIFGADRVTTGRSFVLSIYDHSGREIMDLSRGEVPTGGSFESQINFPRLDPGTYSVSYSVSTTDGRTLRLRNAIRIEPGGSFSHVTDEILQPSI